LSQEIYN